MPTDTVERNSTDYLELLAEVFAEIVQRGVDSKYVAGTSEGEVTPALMQCLQYIYLHGPCSIRRIAEGLSVSLPASSQLVERLAQRNLVTRHESEDDRRLTRVDLTEAGREIASRARSERDRWFLRLCDKLTDEKRTALVDSLEEFIFLAISNEQDIEKACVKCGIDHLAFCVLNRAHEAATGTPLEKY
ncbi:MAG: MarR family transcriptional regulator [Armatimonadota bacterium]|nr:MarR family transcriptional regulator [Armatimonadota bacterium]